MFCIVKDFEEMGVAKVVDSARAKIMVEYFDSPAKLHRESRQVAATQISKISLGKNIRVYFQDAKTERWFVGRVLEDSGNGVAVRFTDKKDYFLKYEEIFVRCNKPIHDPIDYLANVITETPQYAEARSKFLASYIIQRGASWGISALLSSIIELEPHQVNVIRRVLSDASQRYLLADEVGLGKTIEAGVIIRQVAWDDPQNHQIVILVPRVLISQWRQELISRFGLRNFLDDSIFVIAHDVPVGEIDSLLQRATLLVIDEAHHITSGLQHPLYDCVRTHSPNIDRLLLLSATPLLRNEMGFLRMLHLLDPIVYDLSNEQSFRAKINHRQVLAESVAMLDPQNALYLDGVLDDLLRKLPNDVRLGELVGLLREQLLGVPDEDDPNLHEAIRLLRAHLSETYRLHRRILRNRRKHIQFLTPNRSGGKEIIVPESQLDRIESLLEAWRISATASKGRETSEVTQKKRVDFFWKITSALLTEPGDIKAICQERLNYMRSTPEFAFQGEVQLLEELAELVDAQEWLRGRIDNLTREISKRLTGKTKAVVFCSQPSTADAIFKALCLSFPDMVVRHANNDNGEVDEQLVWLRFNTRDTIKVIICDQRGEEGINLQGGNKLVIHFDLPFDPNRIEQRMGRVDRYGAGDPVKSLVMVDDGSKYQKAWYSFLNTALEVFDHSISSLQYLIEDQLHMLHDVLFLEGIEAIDGLRERLGGPDGLVTKELQLIDQQDGLDELSPLAENDLGTIEDIDGEWEDIRQAAVYWACDTLMFGQIPEKNLAKDHSIDPPFRFQYKVPGQRGGASTLIALSWFMGDFMGALDYDDPRSTSAHPLSFPHCARRQTALKKRTRLIRYGDEFIEALKAFSDLDDRGRSYAMWRHIHNDLPVGDIHMYFRFDFLIESSLKDAESVLENSPKRISGAARAAVSRRGDALFPPILEQIWMDEEGDEPTPEFLSSFLTRPYDKHGANGDYRDTNLKSLRFRSLMEKFPATFLNWEQRCIRMRDKAKDILIAREHLANAKAAAIRRARIEDVVREAQLATRIRMLDGVEADSEQVQLAFESNLNSALYRGIENPSIKVDVAGMVILSCRPFPLER